MIYIFIQNEIQKKVEIGITQEKKISELTNKYNNTLQQNTDLAVYIYIIIIIIYRRNYRVKVMRVINYYQR